MSIFREYHNKAKGTFVIPSDRIAKTFTRGDYYRCESHFDSLNAWLRSKGVNTQKPLHSLRKEYGSLINKSARHPCRQQGSEARRYQCYQQFLHRFQGASNAGPGEVIQYEGQAAYEIAFSSPRLPSAARCPAARKPPRATRCQERRNCKHPDGINYRCE
jgi:hypothetical protein